MYWAYNWKVSVSQLRDICEQTKPDQDIFQIRDTLNDMRLLRYIDLTNNEKNNVLLIHSSASFGRYTCSIEYKDEKVVKTDFVYLD